MQRHLDRPTRGVTRAGLIRAVAAVLALAALVANLPQTVPHARAVSTSVVISEFRPRGPVGGNDEFVELFNLSNAPVDISGWKINGSNNAGTTSTRLTVPAGVVLGPGQHYLAVNRTASTGYSGSVAGDNPSGYTTGITDDGGVALLTAADVPVDQVGMSAGSAYKEGTPLASFGSTNSDRSYRRVDQCVDTDNNATDFAAAAPSTPENLAAAVTPCGPPGNTPTLTSTPAGDTPTPTVTLVPTVTLTPTATNTPGTVVRVRQIQGAAHVSPLSGQAVSSVPGIVTARKSNGFYLQDPDPDNDDATAEALFVFTSSAPTVNVGDSVLVSGVVSEFRPGSAVNNLSLTQIGSPTISVVGTGVALPTPVVLGNGGRAIPNAVIANDAVGGTVESAGTPFDPAQDGIDFYESLEGMRVQVNDAVVVGPRNSFNEVWVLADNGANATGRTARGGVVISPGDFNPERIQIDDPLLSGSQNVSVGDRFSGPIVGVIDYDFGNFQLQNTQALPSVIAGGLQRETTSLTGSADRLTIANFNVENLHPGSGAAKFSALAAGIVTNLGSPDIVNLEEVQDNNGATNDSVVDASQTLQTLIAAIAAAGGPTYEFRQIDPADDEDGGQPGGNIRVAFLFNPSRVQFVDRPGGTATAATTVSNVGGKPRLSFSPGRIDPTNAAFEDSRKPLAGEFVFNGRTVFVIATHFNSKGGDQPLFGQFQPPTLTTEAQRLAQANVVGGFAQSILALDSQALIVAAGDFNDFEFSPPLQALQSAGLTSLVTTLPANERYTYVFDGNSQTLDHILVSPGAQSALAGFDIVHMNAEFFDQISDHDPSVARFTLAPPATPTPTNTPTNTPVPPTNTPVPPTNTPTNTPVPLTNTPTNTPVPPTSTPTNTPTPVPAGTIELRLAAGLANNRAFRYDPPGAAGLQVQTFNGEPGCGQFEASPNLMQVSAAAPNGQPRNVCLLAFRLGVDKGPGPGPLDNFRVNQGEKVTFALGSAPTVAGKQVRTAQVKLEGSPLTTVKVTAYNGASSVGSQTVPLSSLTPQGGGAQGNNYTLNVDFGQGFTRLDLEAVAGSFSIVGGANNSGPTMFNLTQ
jgi:predicted extracellular nuclease